MPNETAGYEWKRETGEIESYKHDQTGGWLHIDPQTNFYDREAQPIMRELALEHAGHGVPHITIEQPHRELPSTETNENSLSV